VAAVAQIAYSATKGTRVSRTRIRLVAAPSVMDSESALGTKSVVVSQGSGVRMRRRDVLMMQGMNVMWRQEERIVRGYA
jgi:hypothetical protein